MNTKKKGNPTVKKETKNNEELYRPQSPLEEWLVAIACAFFFPLVYLIGRAIMHLLG